MAPREVINAFGFEFRVGELDGYRLIEVIYPPTVDLLKTSSIISTFFDLWDEPTPSLHISDLSRSEGLEGEVYELVKVVIRRTIHVPGHVASAWVTGDNAKVARDIERLLLDAVRRVDMIFDTRDEAVFALRAFIGSRE